MNAETKARLWEMVKDLEPLTDKEALHFTAVSFRTSPAQPRGWVREYVPRLVRTLLDGEPVRQPAITTEGWEIGSGPLDGDE